MQCSPNPIELVGFAQELQRDVERLRPDPAHVGRVWAHLFAKIGDATASIYVRHLSYNGAYDLQQSYVDKATGSIDKSRVRDYRLDLLSRVITDDKGNPEHGIKEFLAEGRNKFFDSIEDQVLTHLGMKAKEAEKPVDTQAKN